MTGPSGLGGGGGGGGAAEEERRDPGAEMVRTLGLNALSSPIAIGGRFRGPTEPRGPATPLCPYQNRIHFSARSGVAPARPMVEKRMALSPSEIALSVTSPPRFL